MTINRILKGKRDTISNFQTSFVLLVAYRGSPWWLFLHFCPKILGRSNKISFVGITRVVFKFVNGLGCQANVDDSMTINRISIGKGYKVHSRLLVSKIFFKWNIQSLAKYHKITYTGISGNTMAKFITKILTNTLIFTLILNKNKS